LSVQGLGCRVRSLGFGVKGCITQLKVQGPSRTCDQSKEEEEEEEVKGAEGVGDFGREFGCPIFYYLTGGLCAVIQLQGYLAHKKLPPP